jgi:hypothetical protein
MAKSELTLDVAIQARFSGYVARRDAVNQLKTKLLMRNIFCMKKEMMEGQVFP